MRIALSIGHGLSDPGAVNGDLVEHLEAYRIAWQLREAFKAGKHTVELVSCFQQLPGKIREINEAHAVKRFDLAVEVHFNSSADPKANGTEVLYYSAKNQPLAARISKELSSAIGTRDRGSVKRNNLGFLKQTKPPALIVEVLFISGRDTAAIDITFSRRVAEAIASAL